MDEPVDTAAVAAHLKATQGLGSIDIPSAYIPPGSTIRAPSSTSTGARAPISPTSSTPPGLFSAPPTIRARFGIRADGRYCPASRRSVGVFSDVPISVEA
jgi:hypothetical protein